jgi:branched-chain amino acid transport system substrate-binding protein
MRKTGALLWLWLLLLSLWLIPAGCRPAEKAADTEIYIPILADAAWLLADGSFYNGANLAVEEANAAYAATGFTVKTELIDDGALYEKGVEMATGLARDPAVTAVLNLQNFDVSKTTASILAESGKVALFPYGAYDSLFTGDNPYLFCGVPAFSDLGKAMAAYAVEKGYRRIAVYYNGLQSQEELVTAFELALQNSDAREEDYISSIPSESVFDAIYSRWQALGVDCVVIAQYGLDEAFAVLRTIRNRDQELPVIGEPIFNRANALAVNKEIAEGMAVPSTLIIEPGEALEDFKERYRSKYGREADIWAVQGYDMLRLIADTAVKLGTNEPAAIAEALHDQEGYRGVGRHIAFTQGGALVVDVAKLPILICRDGKFE